MTIIRTSTSKREDAFEVKICCRKTIDIEIVAQSIIQNEKFIYSIFAGTTFSPFQSRDTITLTCRPSCFSKTSLLMMMKYYHICFCTSEYLFCVRLFDVRISL